MRSQLKSACLLVAMSSLTATSVTVGVGPTKSDSKAQTPMAPRISTTRQLALPEVCYAPGTPMETIQRNAARRQSLMSGLQSQGFQFSDSSRWDSTATDGGGLVQGQVTTLTWNIVPDGTFVKGFNGEPDANSNLKAFLTGIYGSEAAWVAHFQTVFDQWGALTGINYVKVTEDDGSALAGANVFPFNPGLLGVRADIEEIVGAMR